MFSLSNCIKKRLYGPRLGVIYQELSFLAWVSRRPRKGHFNTMMAYQVFKKKCNRIISDSKYC